ncbi:MAG: glycoside-pentoside-hexuronide (GPH):cation symporter [Eubacterium sp.]|nr:glycoside-pentoside-hexuronide (GPH):cation symporter [Eubacterium sp.]MCM1302934.1 glycoside-pentoside-hexuronide (GPH):cation symporter [Butyrivibrio sp.]MCM1343006.1 glycoside-pentoside-hexuronide (GPH):cation symporter [Muribaculaceae bacterium]MCM1410736.1 glycoside-pentoside-hexuronide (GPH):cation symporter [Lachnospiraceae bacterium]
MKLTNKEKISYGFGAVGKDMVYSIVSGYLLYYYNTVLGISATFIGVLFMAARIFDAFNDPFMGILVEKTNTRMGKFRPWLLIGTITNAVILALMYMVPKGVNGTGLLVYVSVAYILWGVTYTIMDIPFWSMIPAITQTGKDRENLSVIGRSCASVGFAVPTVLTMVVVPILGGGSERRGFAIFALIIAAFFLIAESVTVLNVKEKVRVKQETVSVSEMIRALFKNDQALIVVTAIIVFNASLYLTQQLAIYFFKYDIGNAELVSLFGAVGGGVQIVSMMLLPLFRKKFETKDILKGAISVTIVGYLFMFILGVLHKNNIVLLCIAAMIIFFGFGLATVLTTIFLADTVDYGEWKNGQRSESVIFSLQTFVVKLASAVSALIAGVGLDVIKLDQEAAVQSAYTTTGLRILMLGFPMVGLVISILFFTRKYKLDETMLKKITEELKDRKKDPNM